MERGEQSIAVIVLAIVGIVSAMAAVALFLPHPTGLVMQDESVYVTEDAGNLAIGCRNLQQKVIFLGWEANYGVYCCLEDMIGQNTCRAPYQILITRTY